MSPPAEPCLVCPINNQREADTDAGLVHPDPRACHTATFLGWRYVVLRGFGGRVIAVYRVHLDGALRRMRRPPAALLT